MQPMDLFSGSPLTPSRSSDLLPFWEEDPNRGGDRIAEQFWGDIFAELLHSCMQGSCMQGHACRGQGPKSRRPKPEIRTIRLATTDIWPMTSPRLTALILLHYERLSK